MADDSKIKDYIHAAGPEGKHIFGTVKVGEKGQIVIPRDARRIFDIKPGDQLVMLGDEAQGIALIKSEIFLQMVADEVFHMNPNEDGEDE